MVAMVGMESMVGMGAMVAIVLNIFLVVEVVQQFGYYYYAGMYPRCFSCMAFTMTECGNLFMGVMETMCNKCRVDPVIYFVETNTCRIISDRLWRRQFKLNCILMLTIDIEKAKR